MDSTKSQGKRKVSESMENRVITRRSDKHTRKQRLYKVMTDRRRGTENKGKINTT